MKSNLLSTGVFLISLLSGLGRFSFSQELPSQSELISSTESVEKGSFGLELEFTTEVGGQPNSKGIVETNDDGSKRWITASTSTQTFEAKNESNFSVRAQSISDQKILVLNGELRSFDPGEIGDPDIGFIFGQFSDGVRFTEFLQGAQMRRIIEDGKTVLVASHKQYGELTMSYENSPQLRPISYSLVKTSQRGHAYRGLPMAESLGVKVVTFEESATVVEWHPSYSFVPTKVSYDFLMVQQGGKSGSWTSSFKIPNISKASSIPDGVVFPTLNIPNGQKVSIVGQEGVLFQVHEGQIVKVVDDGTLQSLDGLAVREYSGHWGVWLILCLLALIASATVFYYIRKR